MFSELPLNFPHGGDIEAAARRLGCDQAEILDLSTGLHPDGAPTWLGEWLNTHADLAGHYPDHDGEPARSALAAEFGVAPDNIVIVAGAQAVIEVIFQAMGWQSMAIETPCYNEPVRCARRAGCTIHTFTADGPFPSTDALWWTSPHNPTGSSQPFPVGQTGLLDESYMPIAERRQLGVMPGIIRLGSLTKSFAIPGLRLGYVIADTDTITRLKHWLPPWPASTIALHLLPRLLHEADARDETIRQARNRLELLLNQHGWQHLPSSASFVLAKPSGAMPDFAAARILVRHFPEWPELSGWVRLGLPGDETHWQRLEEVLCLSH